jgi:DNA repair protein RadC
MRAAHDPSPSSAQASFATLLFAPCPDPAAEAEGVVSGQTDCTANEGTETTVPEATGLSALAVPAEPASFVLAETALPTLAGLPDVPTLPIVRVKLARDHDLPLSARAVIRHPQDAVTLFSDLLREWDREVFAILLLDTKNTVLGLHVVSIGTLDSALVSPREVFKAALLASAASIILAHNHPSGDPTPSPEDKAVTKRLYDAGQLLQIDVLDHLVIGESGQFRSLKQLGLF